MSRFSLFPVAVGALGFALALAGLSCSEDEQSRPACELTVTSPKGEEILVHDSTYAVQWTSDGPCGETVGIDLLWQSDSSEVIVAATANDGEYAWLCTRCCGDAAGTGYRIRVTDRTTGRSAVSPKAFAISRPALPAAECEVRPTELDFGAVTVGRRSERAFVIRSVGDLPLEGSVGVSCPGFSILSGAGAYRLAPGESLTVRVRFEPDSSGAAECTVDTGLWLCADVRCQAVGQDVCTPAVLSPNGGESWCAGTRRTILWDASEGCGPTVTIELLRDGTTCTTLAEAAPNTGSFVWDPVALCDDLTQGYAIRISDPERDTRDVSDRTFTIPIACALDLTAPDGGEDWCAGSSRAITWIAGACCGPEVAIELLRDGVPCGTIAERVPNTGRFAWAPVTGCDGAVDGYAVRITDLTTGVADRSRQDFAIPRACAISVPAPGDGERWRAGTRRTLRWTAGSCCGPEVRIDLLRDGVPCATIADRTPNDGSFDWNPVAQCEGRREGYAIRVTDRSTLAEATSPGAFEILDECALTVTAPTGGERWCIGSAQPITWNPGPCTGAEVTIELLLDGSPQVTIAERAPNNGSFVWRGVSRPDSVTFGYRVRVTDPETWISDVSPETFTIAATCAAIVTSPGPGAAWCVGATRTIAWNSPAGWSAEVAIELLRDGVPCRTLAERTLNDGIFTWNPVAGCGESAEGYSIRVTDAASGGMVASVGTFRIPQTCAIAVTSPADGEAWCSGSSATIAWSSGACCGPAVRIVLLRDGQLAATVAAAAPNTGRYTWRPVRPAGSATAGYAIRVIDASSGSSGTSPGSFTIPPACVPTVTSPNGGEAWCAGSARTVTWTAGSCCGDEVRIELLDRGSLSAVLAERTPNDGAFDWLPALPAGGAADGYAIRVVDLETGAADASDRTFGVQPACRLTIRAPEDGAQWPEAGSGTIAWDAGACCGSEVRIELLRDGEPCRVIAERTPNDGSHPWSPISQCDGAVEGYAIRVTDLETGAIAISRGRFAIPDACVLALRSPNGGENWCEGSTQTVVWERGDSCGAAVRIELLRQGSACETLAATVPNTGQYTWSPVTRCGEAVDGYAVRVTDLETGSSVVSRRTFAIPEACSMTVTEPDPGESWCAGSGHTIAWNAGACCGPAVKIELLHYGTPCELLAGSTPNTGLYAWEEVARCGGDAEGYSIRVTDLTSGTSDASEGAFRIPTGCSVTVTSPPGGTRWCEGGTGLITWNRGTCCGSQVRIELLHGGMPCATLAAGTANDGSFTWTPVTRCSDLTAGYAIRVTDLATQQSDVSAGTFEISPGCAPAVTAPNGGELWCEGSRHTLTWETGPCCGSEARIELLRDGVPCLTLAEAAPNTGSFDWDPVAQCGDLADGYAIRVTDLASGAVDVSDAVFTIPDPCATVVTVPNGGELWCEGSRHTLTWETGPCCGSEARIELLRDGVPCLTLAEAAPNTGSFDWDPVAQCGDLADGYAIRVTDLATGSVDRSDGSFTIRQACVVTVLTPNGAEYWPRTKRRTITWTAANDCCGPEVRIELVHDGVPCQTIVASTPNDGSYLWDPITRCFETWFGYRVRVTDVSSGRYDESQATFQIPEPPALDLEPPVGRED